MESTKQKIEDIQAQSTKILSLLKKIEEEREINNEEQDYIDRARSVVEVVKNRLINSDPKLINTVALEKLSNVLNEAITNVNNWVNENNISYISTNLENNLNITIALLTKLTPTMDKEEARASIKSLRLSVARHRSIIEKFIKEISEKGSLADKGIEEKVQEASSQFEVLQTKINELGVELSGIKTSSAQVTTEQQTAFTKAEADRSAAFTNLLNEKQKELEVSVKNHSTELEKSLEVIRKNIEADETAATKAKERVEEIMEIVGDDALIGDYSKTAKSEMDNANLWRWIAAGSLLMAIIAATLFSFLLDGSTVWQQVVAKVVIVLSFAGLAGYAAKQSSEHRDAQREAERMSLQLKAIKPYLGDLEDKIKQDELLIKIADRLFGNDQNRKKAKNMKDENPTAVGQLAEAILDLVKRSRIE